MAIPAGFKTFVAGDVLTADQVNTFLMSQSIPVFASEAVAGSAIASPQEGQHRDTQSQSRGVVCGNRYIISNVMLV